MAAKSVVSCAADEAERDPESHARHGRAERRDQRLAEDQDHRQREPDPAGKKRRVSGKEHIDERAQGQGEIPVALQRGDSARALLFRQAGEMRTSCFEMHHPEGAGVIEDRRYRRRDRDRRIGQVERLGHDEGDRAHHRRHDLAAH